MSPRSVQSVKAAALAIGAAAALSSPALAATATVEAVEVQASPLTGAGLDRARLSVDTDVVAGPDLDQAGQTGLAATLNARLGAVALDEAQGSSFQPNLLYRGFEASPLAGDAQGLAVYLNGARFNQPFGDTVNWDLIPDQAVRQATLEGANPVFGLNALGGSLSIRLKDGFTAPGGELALTAGAFGRLQVSAQAGRHDAASSVYVAADGLREDGWRRHSPSDLRRLYLDLGRRSDRGELHLNLGVANTVMTGNGSAPVELLAADRRAVFTYPDRTENRYWRGGLSGDYRIGANRSLQAALYVGHLSQRTANGDAADVEPCDDTPDLLCLDDDPATGVDGQPIADGLDGGPYGQLNRSSTGATAYGGGLQIADSSPLWAMNNQLVLGLSFDGGRTRFAASSEIGALTADRGFAGPGVILDQPDGAIAPVGVLARNAYWGLYLNDLLELTPAVTLTLSGRWNAARISLRDQRGEALNGDHAYSRFNPGLGLTWTLAPSATVYASWSGANRAPTPAELSCAGPEAPCSLTNFFVGDPDLKQVIAHSAEAGARGAVQAGPARIDWKLAGFRTDTRDDIQFTAASLRGRAYFRNIGETRRQGLEAELSARAGAWRAYLSYALVDARYRSGFSANSPENPQADPTGRIEVSPGDRLPGIARHRGKLGLDYAPEGWSLGVDAVVSSGQPLYGDEANLTPGTRGYLVVNADASYRLGRRVRLFLRVANLFDRRYETFGVFSPTGEVFLREAPGADDPRSLSPAAPRAAYGGVRISF